jgi:hypothetical protein
LDLEWIGSGGWTDYGNPLNWKVSGTNNNPAQAPRSIDTVNFLPGSAGATVCITNGSYVCAEIHVSAGWGGQMVMKNGALTIWGINQTNPSTWLSGELLADATSTSPSSISLIGGSLTYSAQNLNATPSTITQLDAYVLGGGTVNFSGSLDHLGATLHVGDNSVAGGYSAVGTVNFGSLTTFVQCVGVGQHTVLSGGDFNVNGSSSVRNAWFTSTGDVYINGGANLQWDGTHDIEFTGGSLRTGDNDDAAIWGTVDMTCVTVTIGTAANTYTDLAIVGYLDMTGVTLRVDVDTASTIECDRLWAHEITLNLSNEVQLYSKAGTPAAGTHHHAVLYDEPLFGSGMTGTFATTTLAGSGLGWIENYTPTSGAKVEYWLGTPQKAVIGGLLFEDINADNVQNAGETFGNIAYIFTLYDASTGTSLQTVSGSSTGTGTYNFDIWAAGTYYVKVQIYLFFGTGALKDQGGNDAVDNDFGSWGGISLLTGYTSNITVVLGWSPTWSTTVDAGYR